MNYRNVGATEPPRDRVAGEDDREAWRRLEIGFSQLGRQYEGLHEGLRRKLIERGRLRLSFLESSLDRVDLESGILVCTALAQRKSLCICLPDEKPRRPAYLLAFALLSHWWRRRGVARPQAERILYCGTQTGIRGQLSSVSVSGLRESFSDVFGQSDLARGTQAAPGVGDGPQSDSALPRVVTAYAPADARGLIAEVAPRWIAVDFAGSGHVPWLGELLRVAGTLGIPVVGWGTNPMSEALGHFEEVGHVVRWPFGRSHASDATFDISDPLKLLCQPHFVTEVQPLFVEDASANRYYKGLREAAVALNGLRGRTRSSLARTAIQHHWSLYREIETLSVPLSLREAEASRMWGLTALWEQVDSCRRFQRILEASDGRTAATLGLASDALWDAMEYLRSSEPPLWRALSELAHEEAEDGCTRLITFHSRVKKSLFVLALLAELNITEADLRTLGNWVFSVGELPSQRGWSEVAGKREEQLPTGLCPRVTLVSVPTAGQFGRLWPVFLGEDLEIVLHRSEAARLCRRVEVWSAAMSPNLEKLAEVLGDLGSQCIPRHIPAMPERVRLSEGRDLDFWTEAGGPSGLTAPGELWVGSDIEEELHWLLESDGSVSLEDASPGQEESPEASDLWVEEALEIRFSDGWQGLFDRTERLLHIDRHSAQCAERHASALRPGDTVLIIPLHKRQNLYNLVIGRVHMHPSIQLHLAVLSRWHEELVVGFERWAANHGGSGGSMRLATQALLQKIQDLGSGITSSLTVHYWVSGSTICPLDPEDIARVGEVLNLEFAVEQQERIARAASRIRGLHRGLSNRLSNWLSDWSRGVADSKRWADHR